MVMICWRERVCVDWVLGLLEFFWFCNFFVFFIFFSICEFFVVRFFGRRVWFLVSELLIVVVVFVKNDIMLVNIFDSNIFIF